MRLAEKLSENRCKELTLMDENDKALLFYCKFRCVSYPILGVLARGVILLICNYF